MKNIGIVTFHSDTNYGAFLQAFALTNLLRIKGYRASIIDYRKKPNKPHYGIVKYILSEIYDLPRLLRYRRFISPMLSKVRYSTLDKLMNTFHEDFDVLISGSDQIWNPDCSGTGTLNPAYFLAFADCKKYKKISYGSSIGSHVFTEIEQKSIESWLGEYAHLSTREQRGADYIGNILNKEIKVVLDPTLLIDKEQWLHQAKEVSIKDNYVLVYYIDELDEVVSYARKIADKLCCKVALITNNPQKPQGVDILLPHCGPAQFLWLFNKAEYICTNSFHGTAFAVNFNKNFLSILKRNSPHRQQTLLNNVGLLERLLSDIQDIEKISITVDFTEANRKLQTLRDDSINYLINSIEN